MPSACANPSWLQAWGRQVAYGSQFETWHDRALSAVQDIRYRLGGKDFLSVIDGIPPPKPKWICWRTYEHIVRRCDAYLPRPFLAQRACIEAIHHLSVCEARDMASFAYDFAKCTARFAKAKNAHDTLVSAAHRAQAEALEIEAIAKCSLAHEYDAAQERVEIAADMTMSASLIVSHKL